MESVKQDEYIEKGECIGEQNEKVCACTSKASTYVVNTSTSNSTPLPSLSDRGVLLVYLL